MHGISLKNIQKGSGALTVLVTAMALIVILSYAPISLNSWGIALSQKGVIALYSMSAFALTVWVIATVILAIRVRKNGSPSPLPITPSPIHVSPAQPVALPKEEGQLVPATHFSFFVREELNAGNPFLRNFDLIPRRVSDERRMITVSVDEAFPYFGPNVAVTIHIVPERGFQPIEEASYSLPRMPPLVHVISERAHGAREGSLALIPVSSFLPNVHQYASRVPPKPASRQVTEPPISLRVPIALFPRTPSWRPFFQRFYENRCVVPFKKVAKRGPTSISAVQVLSEQREEEIVGVPVANRVKPKVKAFYHSPYRLLKPILERLFEINHILYHRGSCQEKLKALSNSFTKLAELDEAEHDKSHFVSERLGKLLIDMHREILRLADPKGDDKIISLGELIYLIDTLFSITKSALNDRPVPSEDIEKVVIGLNAILAKIASPAMRKAMIDLIFTNFHVLRKWTEVYRDEGIRMKAKGREVDEIIKSLDEFVTRFIREDLASLIDDPILGRQFVLKQLLFQPQRGLSGTEKLFVKHFEALFNHLYQPLKNALTKDFRYVYQALIVLQIDALSEALKKGIRDETALKQLLVSLFSQMNELITKILNHPERSEIVGRLKMLFKGVQKRKIKLDDPFWGQVKGHKDFPEIQYLIARVCAASVAPRAPLVMPQYQIAGVIRRVIDPIAMHMIHLHQALKGKKNEPEKRQAYKAAMDDLTHLAVMGFEVVRDRFRSLENLIKSMFRLMAPDLVSRDFNKFVETNVALLTFLQEELLKVAVNFKFSTHFSEGELDRIRGASVHLSGWGRRFFLFEMKGLTEHLGFVKGGIWLGEVLSKENSFLRPLNALLNVMYKPLVTLLQEDFRHVVQAVISHALLTFAKQLKDFGKEGRGLNDVPSLMRAIERTLVESTLILRKIAESKSGEKIAETIKKLYEGVRTYHKKMETLIVEAPFQSKSSQALLASLQGKRVGRNHFDVAIPESFPELRMIARSLQEYYEELIKIEEPLSHLHVSTQSLKMAVSHFSKMTEESLNKLNGELKSRLDAFKRAFPDAYLSPELHRILELFETSVRESEILKSLWIVMKLNGIKKLNHEQYDTLLHHQGELDFAIHRKTKKIALDVMKKAYFSLSINVELIS